MGMEDHEGTHLPVSDAVIQNLVFLDIHEYIKNWDECVKLASRAGSHIQDASSAAFSDNVAAAAKDFKAAWADILAKSESTANDVDDALHFVEENYTSSDDRAEERMIAKIRRVEGGL